MSLFSPLQGEYHFKGYSTPATISQNIANSFLAYVYYSCYTLTLLCILHLMRNFTQVYEH